MGTELTATGCDCIPIPSGGIEHELNEKNFEVKVARGEGCIIWSTVGYDRTFSWN